MVEKIAIRDAYGEALAEVGRVNKKIVVLEADVGSSSKSIIFGKQFPERYFNVGVSELNMVAMSAGFASAGFIPFVNTFATFLVGRAADPINSMIAYDNLNVKLCGAYCGLSDSYDGASHHSLNDVSFFRSLPNMTVICPCDAVSTKWAVQAAAEINSPVYLRLSRAAVDIVYNNDTQFQIGKGVILRDGSDVTLIGTGYMVQKSLEAAELLAREGINARIVDIHTIKPIDRELIVSCAKETGAVIVSEEHSIYGGLGNAIAEVLAEEFPVPIGFVGMTTFAESGDYEALLSKYKLDAVSIVEKAKQIISRKDKCK
jgi:transketolase